ncbi:hypothetical protein, partial [Pseudomonas sp. 2822-17]|uniref:hypothetical protein n=1 Tax=Pseudomonas sp. 2822-17 TaxID=1712678 RepID=UPI001303F8C6
EYVHFLQTQPYEKVQECKEGLIEVRNNLELVTANLKKKKVEAQDIESKIHSNRVSVVNFRDEKQGLDSKANKGNEYLGYVREVEEGIKKVNELE